MKVVIDIPDEFVAQFARAVAEAMRPMLKASVVSGSAKGEPPRGMSVRPEPPPQEIQRDGYLRLKEVLRMIPVSKTTWYKGVQEGRYPKPTKRFGTRIAVWDIRDIRALMEDGGGLRDEALSA